MHLRWIRLNHHSALFKELQSIWGKGYHLYDIVDLAYQHYLEKHPKLLGFAKDIKHRAWVYLKYLWYTEAFDDGISTYDRFIKWHKELMRKERLSADQLIERFEKLSKKMLPLMPFNRARAQTLLVTEEEDRPY